MTSSANLEIGPVWDELCIGLWHSTTPECFKNILETGVIDPEPQIPDNERWSTGGGPELYPYCRSIGGVSLFEFEDIDMGTYNEEYPISDWRTFLRGRDDQVATVWISIDKAKLGDNFLSGRDALEGWRCGNLGRRIMPLIEACHKGVLPLVHCTHVLLLCSADTTEFKKYRLTPFDIDDFERTLSEWSDRFSEVYAVRRLPAAERLARVIFNRTKKDEA